MKDSFKNNAVNTENVVSIGGNNFRKDHKSISTLFEYWESLRATRAAPKRSEIDPRAIKSILGDVFIAERTRFGGTRFRLAGTEICDLMGMELRGMPLNSLFQTSARAALENLLNDIYSTTCLYSSRLTTVQTGYRHIEGYMVLLPLKDDTEQTTRILGAISLERELLRPPVAFEFKKVSKNRIAADDPPPIPVQGFREERLDFASERISEPQPQQGLRLVVNNDA